MGRSHATADLLRGGWLHTGDPGCLDPDGYLWFKGRLKQIIIRAGSNISPQEVEEALYQHPAVLEAGVVGMPDEAYGEAVVAFVALRAGPATQEELREHTRARLADYKVPERIHFIAELPKGDHRQSAAARPKGNAVPKRDGLIFGRHLFQVVDHNGFQRALARFQLKSQFLYGLKNRSAGSVASTFCCFLRAAGRSRRRRPCASWTPWADPAPPGSHPSNR